MARLPQAQLFTRLRRVKMLIMDVDGVLTDDTLYIGPDSLELKRFNVGDGLATWFARRIGLELAVISSRYSAATVTRARELRIQHVYQEHDKLAAYTDLRRQSGLDNRQFAFMGNDLLDIPLMKLVGVRACPADALPGLKRICHYVAKKPGGHGAVRELIELIMAARGVKVEDMLK